MYYLKEQPKKEMEFLKGFIDFDKITRKLYNNYYIEDYRVVIKTALIPEKKERNVIKIEQFCLSNKTYLFSY